MKLKLLVMMFICACQSLVTKKIDPKILTAKIALIYGDIKQGKYNRAFKTSKALLKKHPNNSQILNTLGIVYLGMKKPNKAIYFLEKAYDNEGLGVVGLNLSSAYIENKNYRKSLIVLQKLLTDKELIDKEKIYHNIGYVYEKLKKYKLAEKYYNKALSEDPIYYMPMYGLGIIFEKQKNTKKASSYFKKASKLCPICYEPVKKLANIYLKQKKTKEAISLMKKFIAEKKIPFKSREKIKKHLTQVYKSK